LRFTPEVLGMTASSALITIGFEIGLIKIGLYLLNLPSLPLLEVVAFCGYKFVGYENHYHYLLSLSLLLFIIL
jgi:hypothetical protein